jgi:hypothetical protein
MREDLKQRLLDAANRRAAQNGFRFTDIARGDLIQFINGGVDRMTESEYQSTSDKDRAERNLMTLIESMSSNGRVRKLTESLDYTSFSESRASVCPLWPFC